MKLPFAVYTARQGYAWQSGLTAGLGRLDGFRKALGIMPKLELGEACRAGAATVGDEVVFFRFMRQEKADFAGRDAVYLAITWCSKSMARRINADVLFSAYPFVTPLMSNYPISFEYDGPIASPGVFPLPPPASSGIFDSSGSLAAIGEVLSHPVTGLLRIFREDPPDGRGTCFIYVAPKKNDHLLPQQSMQSAPPSQIIREIVETSPVVVDTSERWRFTTIASLALNFVLAFAVIGLVWMLRGTLQKEATEGDAILSGEELTDKQVPVASVAPEGKTPDHDSVEETIGDANTPVPRGSPTSGIVQSSLEMREDVEAVSPTSNSDASRTN